MVMTSRSVKTAEGEGEGLSEHGDSVAGVYVRQSNTHSNILVTWLGVCIQSSSYCTRVSGKLFLSRENFFVKSIHSTEFLITSLVAK